MRKKLNHAHKIGAIITSHNQNHSAFFLYFCLTYNLDNKYISKKITVKIQTHNNISNLLTQKNNVKNKDIIAKNIVAVICNSYVLISYKNINQSNQAEININGV